ncbi:MAG: SDR family NAD(P)-dependent oxidoreductase, partial [Lachnospiraceae bacterium]|nr:SDR family NAD(P)-dependent oxidoreductase [Lachnospiraceae bacterium]
ILSKHLHHANRIIIMDVTNPEDMDAFEDVLARLHPNIRMLFQSAGEGLHGRFDSMKRQDETEMVKLNCEALTNITSICLPYMRRGSHIIHLASSAAFMPIPSFSVYCASKAYVLSFSKSLGMELKKSKIHVTAVCPGPVDTPFFDKSERFFGPVWPIKKYIMNNPKSVAFKAICDAGIGRKVSFDTPAVAIACLIGKIFL